LEITNNSIERTSILANLMPELVKWYGKFNFCWREYFFESELREIFNRAGFYYPEKSLFGLLKTDIDMERIKTAVCKMLPEEDSTLLLQSLTVLAGILDIKKAIPLLLDVVKEARCDEDDLVLIIKSLIMLNFENEKHHSELENKFLNEWDYSYENKIRLDYPPFDQYEHHLFTMNKKVQQGQKLIFLLYIRPCIFNLPSRRCLFQ